MSVVRKGFSAEIALCSAEGMFLGVAHTWCSCEVTLSANRRNEQVFTMQCGAVDGGESKCNALLHSLMACNGTYLCAGAEQREHERLIGTRVQPFGWKVVHSRGGLVALYSPTNCAFLGNDLSLHRVVQSDRIDHDADVHDFAEDLPSCQWLCIPVPLKSEEGRADCYFSVTRLLHWGHDSAVLLTEHCAHREPSVAKSIPCARAAAIRRIEAFLYQSNMPGADNTSELLCPMLSKMTSVSPSFFYTQRLCFRSLERIFADDAVAYNDQGDRRLPLTSCLEIIRRIIDIVRAVRLALFLPP